MAQSINGGFNDIFTLILGPPESFLIDCQRWGGPPRQTRIRLSTPVENTTKTRIMAAEKGVDLLAYAFVSVLS